MSAPDNRSHYFLFDYKKMIVLPTLQSKDHFYLSKEAASGLAVIFAWHEKKGWKNKSDRKPLTL